ncbi:MAG: hypothetical protein ABI597_04890 [Gammaproteobacteria bacterium]
MKSHKKPTIKEMALAAMKYSQDHIRESNTHPRINAYKLDAVIALDTAISDTRNTSTIESDLEQTLSIDIDEDETINMFDSDVKITKKFSLGNCGESAGLALEFMVDNYPAINAEYYSIKGKATKPGEHNGDHAFVVIGRADRSDKNDPQTWGDNAYVCDPWANSVYPANQITSRLQNFYSEVENGVLVSKVEALGKHHYLEPSLDNIQLRKRDSNDYINRMNKKFTAKFYHLIDITGELRTDLKKIQTTLEEKYGKNHAKFLAVTAKIFEIENFIKFYLLRYENLPKSNSNSTPGQYVKIKKGMQELLLEVMEDIVSLGRFTEEMALAITAHKHPMWDKFISKKATNNTTKAANEALDKFAEEIKAIPTKLKGL